MKRKKRSFGREAQKKRQPPLKIPLPFDQAMEGLLGLSPEDAKAARDAAHNKKG